MWVCHSNYPALVEYDMFRQMGRIPPRIDLMAVERRMRQCDEALSLADAGPSDSDKRAQLRERFEALEEFAALFEANDELYEQTEKGSADQARWATFEQALIDCMDDGTIWKSTRERINLNAQVGVQPKKYKLSEEATAKKAARKRRSQGGKRGSRKKCARGNH